MAMVEWLRLGALSFLISTLLTAVTILPILVASVLWAISVGWLLSVNAGHQRDGALQGTHGLSLSPDWGRLVWSRHLMMCQQLLWIGDVAHVVCDS